jgi:hypothetical protein
LDLAFTATALALVATFAFATDFLVWAAFFAKAAFFTVFFIFCPSPSPEPRFRRHMGEKITELYGLGFGDLQGVLFYIEEDYITILRKIKA